MSSSFTEDSASKSQTLNSNSVLRLYEHGILLKFVAVINNDPKLTQKSGISESTFKRYRDEVNMDSLF